MFISHGTSGARIVGGYATRFRASINRTQPFCYTYVCIASLARVSDAACWDIKRDIS